MSAFDRAGPRWSASAVVVVAVHGLAIAAGLWWAARPPARVAAAAPEAVMVDLAPLPQAPPAPPVALPPGPRQQQQTPQRPVVPPTPPEPPLPPEVTPEVEEPRPPSPPQPPRDDSIPEQAETVDRSLAPPEVRAPAAARYAAQQTASGAPGAAVASWQGTLLGHLQRYRRYPRAAERAHQQGVAYVRFAVDRQGNVSDARIGRSTGHPALDEEGVATVQRASPLPPPPPDVAGDPVEVMVPVEFFVKKR
jgi:periplasmic protein TonB